MTFILKYLQGKIFQYIGLLKSVTPCVSLQVRRGPRTVQSETKYVELLVVNDYELVRSPVYLLFSYTFLYFFLCNICLDVSLCSLYRCEDQPLRRGTLPKL